MTYFLIEVETSILQVDYIALRSYNMIIILL